MAEQKFVSINTIKEQSRLPNSTEIVRNRIRNAFKHFEYAMEAIPELRKELKNRYEINKRLWESEIDKQKMIDSLKGITNDPEKEVSDWLQSLGLDPSKDIYDQLAERLTPGAAVIISGGLLSAPNETFDPYAAVAETELANQYGLDPSSILGRDESHRPGSQPQRPTLGGSISSPQTIPDLQGSFTAPTMPLPSILLPKNKGTQKPLYPIIDENAFMNVLNLRDSPNKIMIRNTSRLNSAFKALYNKSITEFMPVFSGFPVAYETNGKIIHEIKFLDEIQEDNIHIQEQNKFKGTRTFLLPEENAAFENRNLLIMPLPAVNFGDEETNSLYGGIRAEISRRILKAKEQGLEPVRWVAVRRSIGGTNTGNKKSNIEHYFITPTFYNEETGIYEPIRVFINAGNGMFYTPYLTFIANTNNIGHIRKLMEYYLFFGKKEGNRLSLLPRNKNDRNSINYQIPSNIRGVVDMLNKYQIIPLVMPYNKDIKPQVASAGRNNRRSGS
ncbi:MAG: hypothetical protein KatS3mg087_0427 [Patescibacteria group bacterium]|nr:MAG: hypothetical protein KatS3mg087_0427 [Patescibacteria group bacterium]